MYTNFGRVKTKESIFKVNMNFLGQAFLSIFFVSFCSASCIQYDQPDFVVNWNNNEPFKTINYSVDQNDNTQNTNKPSTHNF